MANGLNASDQMRSDERPDVRGTFFTLNRGTAQDYAENRVAYEGGMAALIEADNSDLGPYLEFSPNGSGEMMVPVERYNEVPKETFRMSPLD